MKTEIISARCVDSANAGFIALKNKRCFNMGFSVNMDWSEELKNPDKWVNHGRNALESACKHKDQCGDDTNIRYSRYCERCGVGEDDAEPMMNYAYPLHSLPDEDKILKVVKETCLTVMENEDTGNCFLVLCGGGMDLSQDIAYAYLLVEGRVPYELAINVCTQPDISQGGIEYRRTMRACKEEIAHARDSAENSIKRIDEGIKKSLEKKKAGKEAKGKVN